MIYKALIKYGYLNFKFEILKYCNSFVLISREQYYIDCLKPLYNILSTGDLGSLLYNLNIVKQEFNLCVPIN